MENKHKILGVSWSIREDYLLFDFCDLLKEFIEIENVTKGVILKFVARIFDPLGITAPAVVKIKLLFQKLCSLRIDWDLTLSEDLIIKWTALLSNLKQLKPIKLPRFYLKDFSFDDINGIEMHCFSDASLKVYGCVIYLNFSFKDGNIVTTFLCPKTKIKPLERISLTIPRLELIACTLISSLIQNCVNSLSPIFNKIKIFCWSDSTDCLYWINNTSKIWKQFIQSRVQNIRDNLPNIKWLHCPGKIPPADISSKGLNLSNDSTLKFWLNGAQCLLCTKELWPFQDIISYNSIKFNSRRKRVTENRRGPRRNM